MRGVKEAHVISYNGCYEKSIAWEIWEMYILHGKLIPTLPKRVILSIEGALPAVSQFSIYNGVEPTEDE